MIFALAFLPSLVAALQGQNFISMQKGYTIMGGDFLAVPNKAKPDWCYTECRNTEPCIGFAWTPYQNGTCWLKSSPGTFQKQADAVSAWYMHFDRDIDYYGNDIKSVQGYVVEDCFGPCLATENCEAFTIYKGKCYLKSAVSTPTFKYAANSAKLALSKCPSGECLAEYPIKYTGPEIKTLYLDGFDYDCCHECNSHQDCAGYSFTRYEGELGECTLLRQITGAQAATKYSSGKREPRAQSLGHVQVLQSEEESTASETEENADLFESQTGAPVETL